MERVEGGYMTSTLPAMEDVETRFELALQYIDKGGLAAQHPGQSPPSHEVLLEYYALYKQAKHGDCKDSQPWKVQVVPYHKWHAWNSKRGMSKHAAMREYVDQLTSKVPKWREWKELPPPAVQMQTQCSTTAAGSSTLNSPVAAAAAATTNAHPSASTHATSPVLSAAPDTPAFHSPAFISSPLLAIPPPGADIIHLPYPITPTSVQAPFSSSHTRCHSTATHPHNNATPNDFRNSSQAQRHCRACYFASALASIICFCAAIILLFSTSIFCSNVETPQESVPTAALLKRCVLYYGVDQSPKLFAFLQLPDAVLLLFILCFFLAAAARSHFIACKPLPTNAAFFTFHLITFPSSLCCPITNSSDALASASAELVKANQARDSLLCTLRSAAGAQVALASISKTKGWSFRCGSRVVSVFFENASGSAANST